MDKGKNAEYRNMLLTLLNDPRFKELSEEEVNRCNAFLTKKALSSANKTWIKDLFNINFKPEFKEVSQNERNSSQKTKKRSVQISKPVCNSDRQSKKFLSKPKKKL